MTNIIFFVLVIFEIVFAAYCIVTVSTHIILKCYSRLISFALFLILCFLGIIDWSFRWYILGALLLLLAIKGLYILVAAKNRPKQFRKKNIIINAILMVLLFATVLIPAFIFPQYEAPQPTGEFNVATAQYTYTSDTITDYFTGGKRQVNVGFWYPKNANGKYPLVVFSHGSLGIKNANISAFEELASHGYVVCSIDHPGHSFYTKFEDGHTELFNKTYLNEIINANKDTYYTKMDCYQLVQKWMTIRTQDINLTIDTILQYAQKANEVNLTQSHQDDTTKLYKLIDCDKIGVFGHSAGAAASVQIGRERKDVDAVINIDGPYFSEITYDSDLDEIVASREQYDIPILNIYSDQVWVQLHDGTDTGFYAGNKISDQICKESYDVYLKGTKHLTLSDLSLVSPFLTHLIDGQKASVDVKENIELEDSIILKFFDYILKGKGKFSSKGVYEQ